MLTRLGHLVARRRRRVLIGTVLAFVVFGALGGGVASRLSTGGFEDPGAESTQVRLLLAHRFGAGVPNFVLLLRAKGGNVDAPAVAAAGSALTRELGAEPQVDHTQVISYWSLGSPPPLRSKAGTRRWCWPGCRVIRTS